MKAAHIYTDRQIATYIVQMEDGSVKFATPALSAVFGVMNAGLFEARMKSKAWNGLSTAEEIVGPEGRLLLATLNAALEKQGKAVEK